jgi:hypothetical protein
MGIKMQHFLNKQPKQQPNMSASAYGCSRRAGARRGYHSTAAAVHEFG